MKIVRWMLAGMVMLALFLSAGMVQAAEPVAMVIDVKGNAWLKEGEKEVLLNVLSYLNQGGNVRLDGKATITLATFSRAAEYTASGPAVLELTGGDVRLIGGGRLERRVLDERKANAAHRFSATQRERLTIAAYEMKALTTGREVAPAKKSSIMDEARSRQTLQQKPPRNAPFSERVLYAVLLESEQMDAADEWKLLAAERPDEPLLRAHLKKH